MKSLSVVVALLLMFVAHELAARMKRAGTLPADTGKGPASFNAGMAAQQRITNGTYRL